MHTTWKPILASLALSASALAQTNEWATDFAPRGVSGFAYDSLAHDDGSGVALYVAGRFTAAGDVLGGSIGKWDGATWRPFPSTLGANRGSPSSLEVQKVALFDNGGGAELYAGGYFESIDGVDANSIARWSGGAWHALGTPAVGPGAGARVTALGALDDGSGPALFVGLNPASFTGLAESALYKWDGVQWNSFGTPLTGTLHDFASFDFGAGPQLVVAGHAIQWGAPGFASVATWDGSSWSRVGAAEFGVMRSLAVHDDGSGATLFVGGASSNALGAVAKWTAGAWQPLAAGPTDGEVYELDVFDEGAGAKLFAAGTFTSMDGLAAGGVARWDGAGWSTLGAYGVRRHSQTGASVYGLATGDLGAGSRLFLAGFFDEAEQTSAQSISGWDGVEFAALGQGNGLVGWAVSLARFGGQLHAGGQFQATSGILQSSLARWDGSQWRETIPDLSGFVTSIASFDDGQGEKLFVAGGATTSTQNYRAWDGVAVSTPGGIGGSFVDIRAQLEHDDGSGPALYVGGNFSSIAGVTARNVAKWDGANWSALGPQSPGQRVNALAFHDDGQGGGEQLYAGGSFLNAGGQTVFGIARYDGASWSPVGLGFNQAVNALAVFDDGAGGGPQLYAGGSFSLAPPFPASTIARWDGTQWRQVGDGLVGGDVAALAVFDDGTGPALYAGGRFLFSGTTSIRRLARWNGSTWEEVGGGVDNDVRVLAALDDGSGFGESLWVGGLFSEAGGVVSSGIARWGKACGAENYCSSGVTSSGCISQLGGIGLASASLTSPFTLAATQLEGARSGHLFYGVNGAIASPWGQSTHFLCVKAPTQRTGTQQTNGTAGACDGAMSLDWNAYSASHPASLGQPFSAGQDVWAQGYFRDPAGPKTTALTNGLHFVICP